MQSVSELSRTNASELPRAHARDSLNLRRLELSVRLGCTLAERSVPQRICVSASIEFASAPPACHSDDVGGTVCAAELSAALRAACQEREFRVVEHLVDCLCAAVRSLLPNEAKLALEVSKPDAPIENLSGGYAYRREDEPASAAPNESPYTLLRASDPSVFQALAGEELRQRRELCLIASENYTYPEVRAALSSALTDKYSEGYPGQRYYAGQAYADAVETLARERACQLFRAEHANVQPLSGSPMNQAVYLALLEPGDTVLAMDLSHGGHLTHGAPASHMGRLFRFARYGTTHDGAIDYDAARRLARELRPKLVLTGFSSYPGTCDYSEFRRIADEVGALTMADISHVGGLVAGGALANPFDHGFDVVTTTTHKSLRGPRAGVILCKRELGRAIDRSVFPGLQGGPHMNTIAGVAVALGKALEPWFRDYARRVLENAKLLAHALLARGVSLVGSGTSNHLLVIDCVQSFGKAGSEAQELLERIGIVTNKQLVPDDPRPPSRPSGLRVGTPAVTTCGMGPREMQQIAALLADALTLPSDASADAEPLAQLARSVEALCWRFEPPVQSGFGLRA